MKKFSKIFLSFILVCCFILSGNILTACNENTPFSATLEDGVAVQAAGVLQALNLTSFYNQKEAGTTYSLNDLELTRSDYYVKLATVNGDVNSLTFGEVTFNKNETFKLSIGNSAFIEANAFLLENNNLYVPAVLISMELSSINKIKINNNEYEVTGNKPNSLNVNTPISQGSRNSVEYNEQTQEIDYTFGEDVSAYTEYLFFGVRDNENNNIGTNYVALTRKYYKTGTNAGKLAYDLTKTNDTVSGVNGVAFYPSFESDVEMEYTFLVVNEAGEFLGISSTYNIKSIKNN